MVPGTICVRCTAWQDQGTKGDSVCVAEEDYLRDGLNKTDAIVSSLDLNQAVAEVIPVVFSLAKKGCLLFLVELRKTHTTLLLHNLTTSSVTMTLPINFISISLLRVMLPNQMVNTLLKVCITFILIILIVLHLMFCCFFLIKQNIVKGEKNRWNYSTLARYE